MEQPHSDETYASINMEKIINTVKQSLHNIVANFLKNEGVDMIGYSLPDGSFSLHPTIAHKVKSFKKDEMIGDGVIDYIAKQIINDLISHHIEG